MCVMHAIMYVRHTVCAINICTHALTVYTLGQERNDAYTTGIDHARERAEQLVMDVVCQKRNLDDSVVVSFTTSRLDIEQKVDCILGCDFVVVVLAGFLLFWGIFLSTACFYWYGSRSLTFNCL